MFYERYVERAIFGDSRTQTELLTGTNDLKDLLKVTEIALPQSVHQYAVDRINQTLGDGRERWALFSYQDGLFEPSKAGIGTAGDIKTGRATSGSTGIGLGDTLFGQPINVHFHTHPIFDAEWLESQGVEEGNLEDASITLTTKQIAEVIDFATLNFSGSDLKFIQKTQRILRSALLGSAYGFRWIINVRFNLPITASVIADAKEYGKSFDEIRYQFAEKIGKGEEVDRQQTQNQVDDALKKYCAKIGLVAFGNDDPTSSILHRL